MSVLFFLIVGAVAAGIDERIERRGCTRRRSPIRRARRYSFN